MRISSARVILSVAMAAVLAGCVSSEETGGTGRSQVPQVVMRPADTPRATSPPPATADTSADRTAQAPSTRTKRSAPTFTTKQDTVRASTVRTTRTSTRPVAPIERPANASYTIQIGAFARAENALRMQKRARRLFQDIPVFNIYVPAAKLYRVSVGRFETRSAANRFRIELLKNYPKEYEQCWINYVAR